MVFDIAHNDALTMCKVYEDREFLIDQRKERKIISSEDKKYNEKQERILQRKMKEQKRLEKEDESPEHSDSASFKSEEMYKPSSLSSLKRRKSQTDSQTEPIAKKSLFSTHVTSALDRNKVSDREALRLMVPIAAALGHDPSSLPLSRSTIQRKRKEGRKAVFKEIKQSVTFDVPVIVHWDGKILPDILGNEKVDRLPVLVSADGKGLRNGACVMLEHKVGKELLWLACRHHILEIVLSKVFTLCFGPSSSPDISLFKRFKVAWPSIHQENYKLLEEAPGSENFKLSAVNALLVALGRKNQPRDDYMELIELSLLALGHTPDKIYWRAPGAVHHARWMAKLLYAIKIYLFREEDGFKTTLRKKSQLERFVNFGALVYVKYWIEAPIATNAWADLFLWKDMTNYEVIDPQISEVVKNAIKPHLWYLSDELVGLSLFSEKVSNEEKVKIVKKMGCEPTDRKEDQNGIVVLLWKDTRDVRLLSTKHSPIIVPVNRAIKKFKFATWTNFDQNEIRPTTSQKETDQLHQTNKNKDDLPTSIRE
ncbi:unnamed protein product [Brassicogethes aeneus]|uniref:Uncharacterized protein n=1 Tax=Brassicogethes aeneus TaxID=1431903 RepID=A0A9P0BDF9_BRAAE|nr:unnamed protein product [Brassicogethes aeneus]